MSILYITLTLVGFVGTTLVSGYLTRKNHGLETAFFRSVFLIVLLFPLLLMGGFDGVTPKNLIAMFGIGFFAGIGFYIQLESMKYLPVGIVTALVRLYNIPVLILGYLFYNETLTLIQGIGATILLGAGIVLSMLKNNHAHLIDKPMIGLILVLLRIITQVLWVFGFAYFARNIGVYTTAFFSEATTITGHVFLITLFHLKGKPIFTNLSSKFFKYILLISGFSVCFTIGFLNAVNTMPVGYVTLWLSSGTIFVSLISHFIFGENLRLSQWLLILLSFIGLILINM